LVENRRECDTGGHQEPAGSSFSKRQVNASGILSGANGMGFNRGVSLTELLDGRNEP
jgi:hypothetical protein